MDTRENCWKFFIDRVRRQLKVVLCFSPVGSVLRVRSRKFPALVNCTSINWFHEWPQQALMSVSNQFLSELEVLPVNNFFLFSIEIFIYNWQQIICALSLGKLQRICCQVYGLRTHTGQHHIANIFAEWSPIQLYNPQIIFGTDITLL